MTTVTSEKAAETLQRLWHTAHGRAEPAPHYRRLHQLGPVLALPDGTWIIVGYAVAERADLLSRRTVRRLMVRLI